MAEVFSGIPINSEPKRPNRFFLEFPTDVGIQVWKVMSVDRPSFEQTSVEIPFFNTADYVIGQYKWGTINIKLRDVIGPSSSQGVMEWVRLHSESLTGRQGYAIGYKKNLIIKQCDPTGVEIEKWILEQCMIVSANFGTNDYSDDNIATIDLTVQPFRCILEY